MLCQIDIVGKEEGSRDPGLVNRTDCVHLRRFHSSPFDYFYLGMAQISGVLKEKESVNKYRYTCSHTVEK